LESSRVKVDPGSAQADVELNPTRAKTAADNASRTGLLESAARNVEYRVCRNVVRSRREGRDNDETAQRDPLDLHAAASLRTLPPSITLEGTSGCWSIHRYAITVKRTLYG
jgi:hypothetical protein